MGHVIPRVLPTGLGRDLVFYNRLAPLNQGANSLLSFSKTLRESSSQNRFDRIKTESFLSSVCLEGVARYSRAETLLFAIKAQKEVPSCKRAVISGRCMVFFEGALFT